MRRPSPETAEAVSLWLTSLMLAILLTTIPFTFVATLLARMPRPLASSYGQWPAVVNGLVIGAVTAAVTVFVHSNYVGGGTVSLAVAARFLLVALIYAFGFSLLLRQAAGVYPEFIVTLGWAGLGLKKTVYRNILRIETISSGAETRFRIDTAHGVAIRFTLPTSKVVVFQEQLRLNREREEA
jgi:hypothetical protein